MATEALGTEVLFPMIEEREGHREIRGTGTRVCIVQPNPPTASETFLAAHAAHLPARVAVIHGDPPWLGDRAMLGTSWVARAGRKARRILTGRGPECDRTEAYLRAFDESRPEVVLAEYGTMGVRILEACRQFGVPLVVHFHGFDASVHEVLATHRESYKDLFRSAAAVVAVSRAMRARLIQLGASPNKTYWNSCGVDCQKFGGAVPDRSPPVFLAVGRLVEKKAPQLTLRAFAAANRVHPEARLRIAGDGPLRDECRHVAEELGISDAVTFLGTQPPEVIQGEMRRARCFVQHSVEASSGDCEGTPVGILEAGASGLPVISTRHGGIPDVVIEGGTGFLVDEGDVHGMADHMRHLVREPDLAGAMGRSARRRIEAEFTMEHRIESLWTIMAASIVGRVEPAARVEF